MKNLVKFVIAAAVTTIGFGSVPANAQMAIPQIGVNQFGIPMCSGPLGPGPCAEVYNWMQRNGINPNGRDAWGVMGPAIGAGAAAGLQMYGVPAPVAGWAGERINQNAQAAYRERGVINQGIRTGTGVSVRDIQERGICGGDNSVARQLFGGACG